MHLFCPVMIDLQIKKKKSFIFAPVPQKSQKENNEKCKKMKNKGDSFIFTFTGLLKKQKHFCNLKLFCFLYSPPSGSM